MTTDTITPISIVWTLLTFISLDGRKTYKLVLREIKRNKLKCNTKLLNEIIIFRETGWIDSSREVLPNLVDGDVRPERWDLYPISDQICDFLYPTCLELPRRAFIWVKKIVKPYKFENSDAKNTVHCKRNSQCQAAVKKITLVQTRWLKCISLRPTVLKSHTLWGCTCLLHL